MLFSKTLFLVAITAVMAAPTSINHVPSVDLEPRLGCYGNCFNNNCVGKTGSAELKCNTMCDNKCGISERREPETEPELGVEDAGLGLSLLEPRLGCFGNCYNNNCAGETGQTESKCHTMCDNKCNVPERR